MTEHPKTTQQAVEEWHIGGGEGSSYQLPDGRWRAAVSLDWRGSKAGQPILRRKIVIGKTRFEAQEEFEEVPAGPATR